MNKKELVDRMLHEMVINSKPEETFTYQQIGNQVGLSHERIRQIEAKALKKVKFKFQQLAKKEGLDKHGH
tara:strand:+ start:233 stop:442 length:210 start_codon:yes stop_codon:yes gene_type:complete